MSARVEKDAAIEDLLSGTDAERFAALAKMSAAQYDRVREEIAKGMGIRVTTLDAEVEKARHPEPPPQANGHDTSAQMPSEIVEAMNEQHALIWQSGELRVLWRHEWDGGAPRTSSVNSTRLYYRNQEVRNSNPIDVWIESPNRAEFDRIAFEPGNTDPRVFNLWRGWSITPMVGDCSLILAHIKTAICSNDEALNTYVLSFLADIAQHPEDPKGTAVALRGPAGAGKGAFWRYCEATFAPYILQIITPEHFLTRFNDHLAGKLLVYIDEAVWAGNRKGLGQLKGIITERRILVERKHQPAFTIENLSRFLFATNEDWAIPADFDDRRFVMLDVGGALRNNDAYFKALDREQKTGGAAAFLHYLLHFPISVNLRHAPTTEALAKQKLLSLDDVGKFWRLMLTAHQHELSKGRGREADQITVRFGGVIRTTDLYDFYLAHAQRSRIQHPASFDALGCALRRFCPGIVKREARKTDGIYDPEGKRLKVYALPTLAEAREQFATALRRHWTSETPRTACDGSESHPLRPFHPPHWHYFSEAR
jgi:hypothetical protein